MPQPVICAGRSHFPNGTLVFDRFHVVKPMNDKLPDLRRELQRQADADAKKVRKTPGGCSSRTSTGSEDTRTSQAGPRLPRSPGWRLLPEGGSSSAVEPGPPEQVARVLEGGIDQARVTGTRPPYHMANTRSLHRSWILTYYGVPITSGPPGGAESQNPVPQAPGL